MTLTRTTLLRLAIAGSAATLIGAFVFQYGIGFLPCHLCILQRYPHWIMGGLGLICLVVPGRILPVFGLLTALYSFGLALYHSGVERKIWSGPTDCSGGMDLSRMSGADLLSTEVATPVVACDEISFSLLGVTFANANAIGSVALIVIWIAVLRRS